MSHTVPLQKLGGGGGGIQEPCCKLISPLFVYLFHFIFVPDTEQSRNPLCKESQPQDIEFAQATVEILQQMKNGTPSQRQLYASFPNPRCSITF